MEKTRVILTDGAEVFEEQVMTEDEMDEANAEAMVATAGDMHWEVVG